MTEFKLRASLETRILTKERISVLKATLLKRVVSFILGEKSNIPATSEHAREIMGNNLFGIEEAKKFLNINPTKEQLAVLSKLPFSETTLRVYRKTHILVAVFPLSIIEIRGMVSKNLFLYQIGAWYDDKTFANERGQTSWYLISKLPHKNSLSKSWIEQQKLLGKNEEVPSARVVTYATIAHYLSTKERILRNVYVRCKDFDSKGCHVSVGNCDPDGFHFEYFSSRSCSAFLGLTTTIKLADYK